ncbi:MAG: class I SAM-dependent methyltransferase [Candidatus Omnitrophica bacterium]|nr:class I SAM-dependent methyltransferase [Candidatus Omnitrophota bacterium]
MNTVISKTSQQETFPKARVYYTSSRPEIVRLFPDNVKRALDVGCGSGNLGRSLKECYPDLEIIGIEVNNEASQQARKYYSNVLTADIESSVFSFAKNYFDVIILADVLEHLKDPWALLKQSRAWLREGGCLLISIPNIRYYRCLLNLACRGQFKYEPHGILDIGHLRFFTLRMTKGYLAREHFVISKIERNFSGYFSWFFNLLAFNIFADFFTRQYLILAKKKGGIDETDYSNSLS